MMVRHRITKEEAKILKKAMRPMLENGIPYTEILERLNAQGITRRNGEPYRIHVLWKHGQAMGFKRGSTKKAVAKVRANQEKKTHADSTLELVFEVATVPGMTATHRLRIMRAILNQYPHGSYVAPVQA